MDNRADEIAKLKAELDQHLKEEDKMREKRVAKWFEIVLVQKDVSGTIDPASSAAP